MYGVKRKLSGLPGKRQGRGDGEEKEIKSKNRAGTQSRFEKLPSKSPYICVSISQSLRHFICKGFLLPRGCRYFCWWTCFRHINRNTRPNFIRTNSCIKVMTTSVYIIASDHMVQSEMRIKSLPSSKEEFSVNIPWTDLQRWLLNFTDFHKQN